MSVSTFLKVVYNTRTMIFPWVVVVVVVVVVVLILLLRQIIIIKKKMCMFQL